MTDEDYHVAASRLEAQVADGPVWVFAYGSLIWKQAFEQAEVRRATAFGWHRSFCMIRRRWRGSPAQPGLMMALERGGSCDGVAFRLGDGDRIQQIERLLRREVDYREALPFMRWVPVTNGNQHWTALGSWVGPMGSDFVARQPLAEVSKVLARACGHIGSGAEYLFNTVVHLEKYGIRDRNLWRLQQLVAEEIRSIHGV